MFVLLFYLEENLTDFDKIMILEISRKCLMPFRFLATTEAMEEHYQMAVNIYEHKIKSIRKDVSNEACLSNCNKCNAGAWKLCVGYRLRLSNSYIVSFWLMSRVV
jgi:hypothetical protein